MGASFLRYEARGPVRKAEVSAMIELTCTLRQWRATARCCEHQEIGRPDLAEQIRWAFPANPRAHPDTPITVRFIEADAAVIEHQVPGGTCAIGSAREAVAAAEAIIALHQRHGPG